MTSYSKPYLPLTAQLDLLKRRGLLVDDDAAAIECLHRNGYYRLSAYWYPFREFTAPTASQRSDTFKPGSRFEDAVELYIFDKKLKLLLLDAVERVEIAVRVDIALLLGARDRFAHTNSNLLHTRFRTERNRNGVIHYQEWMAKFRNAVDRSTDQFVLHYEAKYGSRHPLPIWIAIELWDFGLLSRFYSGMQVRDREAVAQRFSVPDWQLMQSWLRCLNYIRNVIAHHGRLWNLNLIDNPRLPAPGVMPDFDALTVLPSIGTRIYSICCILSHLSRVTNPRSSWSNDLVDLVNEFPSVPHVSIQDMGFPPDWQTHPLWI